LHEELFGGGELDVRPRHPLISHVQVPPLDPTVVRDIDVTVEAAKLIEVLADLCVVSDVDDAPVAPAYRPRATTLYVGEWAGGSARQGGRPQQRGVV